MGYEYEVYVWNGHEYEVYWQGETWPESVAMMNRASSEGFRCIKVEWRPGDTQITQNTRPDGVVEALKLAYRKHWLNDDSIGWDELGDKLCDALCNAMGDKEFSLWLQQMKAAVGGE